MSISNLSIENLEKFIGTQVAKSDWLSLSQHEVDQFAENTQDPDPMHIDPDWAAKNSPYGQTVLAGFNILSFLPHMARHLGVAIKGASLIMNYGFERIRFISPVPVGQRFRNNVVIKAVERRSDGKIKLTTTNTIEVEGSDRPAVVAEWVNIIWP